MGVPAHMTDIDVTRVMCTTKDGSSLVLGPGSARGGVVQFDAYKTTETTYAHISVCLNRDDARGLYAVLGKLLGEDKSLERALAAHADLIAKIDDELKE